MCICSVKLIALLLLFFTSLVCSAQEVIISFGSCANQDLKNSFWPEILSHNPDVWLWGGDNIYADTGNFEVLQKMYRQQSKQTGYRQLTRHTKITGVWDDHDFGTNDGGKFFAQKEITKKAAVEFLQFDKDDPVRQREGLYSTTTIKNIRIINLDTRYFRDTVYKYYFIDSLTQKRTYGFKQNTEGDILGEAQWLWLEKTLAESNEKFIIVNSSVQVIARDQRWEKWGNFPNSLNRLHMLIAKFPEKRVMFISGDRHIAEISSEKIEGVSYPLYDFTSSGLTHTWDSKKIEKNRFRVGELIIEKNYGIIRIKENINNYAITMQVWGEQKKVLLEENVTLPK